MIRRLAVVTVVGAVGLGLPYRLGPYWMHVVDVAIIYGILALGLCVTMGIAGQVNLAQVAFFGAGAYTSAVLTAAGVNFWVAALAAIMLSAAVGLLVSIPALRVQSHYLGIVTLGLALAFSNVITNAGITGQAQGLNNLPVPPLPGIDLSSDYLYYYLEALLLALCFTAAAFVVRTPLGRRLRAMRDDTLAAASMGAETPYLRMTAFVLGALFGGVAGALYAGLIRFVSPESFSISSMFFILAGVIIGGRFSLLGSVVGTVLLVALREELSNYSNYAQLIYGSLVVLIVVFSPTGLAGLPDRLRALRASRERPDRERRRRTAQRYESMADRPPVPEPVHASAVALAVTDVTKRFRGITALAEVNLAVPEGQIRGVVGPNGSGKTTLFNVVSGLYGPSAGQVSVHGSEVAGAPSYRIAQLGVARTFQNLRLFSRMTVRENILVALDKSRIGWFARYGYAPWTVWRVDAQLRRQSEEVLDRFGLTDVANTPPTVLSYGTQRRVEIARAMARQPRLLLLDEPAAGLNGDEVQQLSEIVRDVRAQGVTVVLIEHNMGLVMSLCEQVTVLANGRVIADGPPAEVSRNTAVIEAYLGDSHEVGTVALTTEATQ